MLDRFNVDNNYDVYIHSLVGTRHFIRLMSILIRITQLMKTHADSHIHELNFH